jgi:hypothetical protein
MPAMSSPLLYDKPFLWIISALDHSRFEVIQAEAYHRGNFQSFGLVPDTTTLMTISLSLGLGIGVSMKLRDSMELWTMAWIGMAAIGSGSALRMWEGFSLLGISMGTR